MKRVPLIPVLLAVVILIMSAVGIMTRVVAPKTIRSGTLGPVMFTTDFPDDVTLILESCPDAVPTEQSVWTPVATASLGAFHSATSSTSLVPTPDFSGSVRVQWGVNATLAQITEGNEWVVRDDLADIEITEGRIRGTLGFTRADGTGTIVLSRPVGRQSIAITKQRGMFVAELTDLALSEAPPGRATTIPTPTQEGTPATPTAPEPKGDPGDHAETPPQ